MNEHVGHGGHDAAQDPIGRRVGILVAVIGVFLSAVTIESHREHTAAIFHKTEANDTWGLYQAKKMRSHLMDVGVTILNSLGTDPARVEPAAAKLAADRDRYTHESDDLQKEARAKDEESELSERRALRFDLGEGLLELGLVLSSLYFLSKKIFFPWLGIFSSLVGLGCSVTGLLL
jgi:hypothetical protein